MNSVNPEHIQQPATFDMTQDELAGMHPEFFVEGPDWLPTSAPKTSEELDAITFEAAKTELDQLPYFKLGRRLNYSEQGPTTYVNSGEGFQIPVERIISADGFDVDTNPSWAGRRGGVERSGGVLSLDKIIDYARRGKYEHNPRTLEEKIGAEILYAPDGEVFYRLQGGNHRGSAAKLRGDKTLTVKYLSAHSKDKATLTEGEYEQLKRIALESGGAPTPAEVPTGTKERPTETDWQKVGEAMEQLGLTSDVKARAALVAKTTAEDLVAEVAILHSVLAPDADQNPTDFAMSVSSPNGDNKRALLDPSERFRLFDKAAQLTRELAAAAQDGEEQQFLNRASSVVAMAVVMAHPFEDGNGRTARTLAQLIRTGYNPDVGVDDDLQLVGTNRTYEGFRINSYLPKDKTFETHPSEFLEQVAALNIPIGESERYAERAHVLFTSPYGD